MDTTEQYIKMCEKAEVIQKGWKPSVGDYTFRKYTIFGEVIDLKIWSKEQSEEIIILHYKSSVDGYFHACDGQGNERIFNTQEEVEKVTSIWLPRQDQLQKMLIEKEIDAPQAQLWYRFQKFVTHRIVNIEEDDLPSWEQLWLTFMMENRYSKTWSGEDWVEGTHET